MTRNDAVSALYGAAVANQLPVALWRTPDAASIHAIADLSGAARSAPIDFGADGPSFVMAPFRDDDGRSALRIRADVHLVDGQVHARSPFTNGQHARYERFLRAMDTGQQSAAGWYAAPPAAAERISTRQQYCDLVRAAKAFIGANDIKKVVISRRIDMPLPPGFSAVAMFLRLCRQYPAAFVSLIAAPGVGTWLGASPELLLSVDSTSLGTVALAGTQPTPIGCELTAVRWSAKEIEEQALVSDDIRSFFAASGYARVIEQGPETVCAGNVAHLQSRFSLQLPEDERLALAHRILHELHPTSAVCGMPKDKALAFILEHEGYSRGFYSGYLGPVQFGGRSSLYVNLRCLQLRAASASLYVGGGVTADSDPEAEWRETELKADTLLAVLQAEAASPDEHLAAAFSPSPL